MPDEPLTQQRVDQLDVAKVRRIYARLEGIWYTLENVDADIIEGSLILFTTSLDELGALITYDYNVFKPHIMENDDGKQFCRAQDLRTQVSALMNELRVEYLPEQISPFTKKSEGILAITQNQVTNQQVSFSQLVLADLPSKLDEATQQYTPESKEHLFFKTIRESIGTIRDMAGLFILIMSTAEGLGIDPDTLRTLLQSIGLGQ